MAEIVICPLHKKQSHMFCNSCEQVICFYCQKSTHAKHDISDWEDALKNLTPRAKQILENRELYIKDLNANIQGMQDQKSYLDDQRAQITTQIEATYNELLENLAELKEFHLKHLNEKIDEKHQTLDGIIENYNISLQSLKNDSMLDFDKFLSIQNFTCSFSEKQTKRNPKYICLFDADLVKVQKSVRYLWQFEIHDYEAMPQCSPEIQENEHKFGQFHYDQDLRFLKEGQKLIEKGPIRLPSGDMYLGQWTLKGIPHGKGIILDVGENKYEGYIKSGLPHWKGRVLFKNGAVYSGELKRGKIWGNGTQTWPNGNIYEGEWKDGKRHGKGSFTFGTGKFQGDKFVGDYFEGFMDGFGTYQYANGDTYKGQWKKNKKHGIGVYIMADGKQLRGIRESDQLIEQWPDSTVPPAK